METGSRNINSISSAPKSTSGLEALLDHVSQLTHRVEQVNMQLHGILFTIHDPRPEPVAGEAAGQPAPATLEGKLRYLSQIFGAVESATSRIQHGLG